MRAALPSPKRKRGAGAVFLCIGVLAAGCGVDGREVRTGIELALNDSTLAQSNAWAEDVHDFYARRGMRPAWTHGRGLNGRGREVLVVLESATTMGLDPARYDVDEARRLRRALAGAADEQENAALLAALDVHLTTGLRRYLGDLRGGALEPAEQRSVQLALVLDSLADARHPQRHAAALEPSNAQYRNLKSALARYSEIARSGGWSEVAAGAADSAATAGTLRERLIAEGDPREQELAERSAGFDEDLASALRHFQARHGLEETGTLDSMTLQQLNTPVEERVASLSLNLDRLRTLPRDSAGLRIFVNVPAYEMVVLQDDAPLLSMPVIVGKAEHQTPVLIDTVRYVVTNPYWNVPQSIFAEEILPALQADPSYLNAKNMEVVSHEEGGGVIDEGSIDWDRVDPDSVPWMIRQRPGPWNALGRVKFLFPNRQNIYLHDTPESHLFERTVRALSHGCIRLERPLELARLVLDRRTDLSAGALDELLARPGEKHVPLNEGIPVAIVYLTSWIGPDGDVQFLRDIYGRDAQLRAEPDGQVGND